jgi:hypothetical protein
MLLLGLLLGAYPLLRFNLKSHGITVRQNAHLTLTDAPAKVRLMASTLNGEAEHGAFVQLNREARDRVRRPFAALSMALARTTGLEVSTFLLPVGAIAIFSGLLLGDRVQRRWIAFFFTSGLIGWAEAVLTFNAGLSIHHTDLFLVQFYPAVAIGGGVLANCRARSFSRPVVALMALFVCGRALLATNAIYAEMITYETGIPWTNAEKPMVARLLQSGVKRVIAIDWGISDVVTARSHNRIAVDQQPFALPDGRLDAVRFLACQAPECAIVGHVPPADSLASTEATFESSLSRAHLQQMDKQSFFDTHGVPVLFSFQVRRRAD